MPRAILGKKIGMTQIFLDDGRAPAVTAIQAGPCHVLQIRNAPGSGLAAVQLGFDPKREKSCTKPELGHFRKAGVQPCRFVREVRMPADGLEPGKEIRADIFKDVHYVHVTGWTKGRGFAGVVKRHGFHGAPASHGQTEGERVPGSLGRQGSVWGKVHKGKRMAGRYGNERRTVRNLEIVRVIEDQNVLLVRGAVPGPSGGYLIIRESEKRRKPPKQQPSKKQKVQALSKKK